MGEKLESPMPFLFPSTLVSKAVWERFRQRGELCPPVRIVKIQQETINNNNILKSNNYDETKTISQTIIPTMRSLSRRTEFGVGPNS